MELILYVTHDDEHVIHKTKQEKTRVNIVFKNRTNIINPDIRLRTSDDLDLHGINYAYLPDFNRYYFIRSMDSVESDLWNVSLECDVLETYQDSILSGEAEISRPIQEGDYQSVSLDSLTLKEVDIFKSDVVLEKDQTMILSTLTGV